MAQVAEAYVRTDHYPIDEESLQRVGRLVERLSYDSARLIYPRTVKIEIYVEPGSLKAWAKVSATAIGLLYGAVATYPDFKNGLREAVGDARAFSTYVIEHFRQEVDSGAYGERRTKTPGRLLRNLDRLEKLEHDLPQLTQREISQEIARIRWGLQSAFADLPFEEARPIEDLIKGEHGPRLPQIYSPRFFTREPELPAFEDLAAPQIPPRAERPPLSYYGAFELGRWKPQIPPPRGHDPRRDT